MKYFLFTLACLVMLGCSEKDINATAGGIGDGVKNIADGINTAVQDDGTKNKK
jgi:hypothetical protein